MIQTKTIRVMIADDHHMVRSGLAAMLSTCKDMELVGEAGNGEIALYRCEEVHPDVILMDLVMPVKDGVETTIEIKRRHPDVQVIALTSYDSPELIERALKAGALSFLLKDVSMDELAEAIRNAALGKSTLAPAATKALIESTRRVDPPGHDLTSREREVLRLLTEGHNNQQIANRLIISRSTVKHHVSSILAKLDASNRAEAVAIAMEHRLVH